MKYTNRADLLIAAGESIKMQEKHGVFIPIHKYAGEVRPIIKNSQFDVGGDINNNEFPIAVIEGKPVFVGDELYDSKGNKFKILDFDARCVFANISWNPPKPKTVMVELLVEDAQFLVDEFVNVTNINAACRKALGELK